MMKSTFFSKGARAIEKKGGEMLSTFGLARASATERKVVDQKPFSFPQNQTQAILQDSLNAFRGANEKPFNNVLLVSIQHCLGTTYDMFATMKEAGLKDAVFSGKSYSTHKPTVDKIRHDLKFDYVKEPDQSQLGYGQFNDCMTETVKDIWKLASEKIAYHKYDLLIALDDGADLLRRIPKAYFNGLKNKPDVIIGVEQTKNGSSHPYFAGLPFPIINVAGSFSKTIIEYPRVARKIANTVIQFSQEEAMPQLRRPPVIGIVGNGVMGKAIVEELYHHGFPVVVYDKSIREEEIRRGITYFNDPGIVFSHADIIVGCTGVDITSDKSCMTHLLFSRQNKWLISASSKDTEFNRLLLEIQNKQKQTNVIPNLFDTLRYQNKNGATLTIARGGFPANFDNSEHSVEPQHIWPTRAALMHGCLYAARLFREAPSLIKKTSDVLMLPPEMQLHTIKKYIELNPDEEHIQALKTMSDDELLDKIRKSSEGALLDDQLVIQEKPMHDKERSLRMKI